MATIASELQRIQIAKSDIKDTLESKGVVVDANKSVSNYFLYADSLGDYKKELPTIETTDPLTMVQIDENGGSVMIVNHQTSNAKVFQYKLNNGEWTNYTLDTPISMVYGDKIQWRSQDTVKFTTAGTTDTVPARCFVGKGRFILGGKINSLNNNTASTSQGNYAFCFFGFPVVETYVQLDTSVTSYEYERMYQGCSILKKADFTISAVNTNAYYYMFYGCRSLEEAPINITAQTVANNCYRSMFQECDSLTVTPPILPATTAQNGCYHSMFSKCSSLKYPPFLALTTLGANCCMYMFEYCVSLEETPMLLSTSYVDSSYNYMFRGAVNLKRIYLMNTPSSAAPSNWMQNVGNNVLQSGDLLILGNSNTSIPSSFIENSTRITNADSSSAKAFSITPKSGRCSVKVSYNGTGTNNTYYCGLANYTTRDSFIEWEQLQFYNDNETSYNIPEGYSMWISCPQWDGNNNNITISISKSTSDYVVLGGELFSLVGKNRNEPNATIPQYGFKELFKGQDFSFIRFSDNFLNYRYLNVGCYQNMFENCTGLTFGANQNLELPATSIPHYAYKDMFKNSSITSVPEIKANTFNEGACFNMCIGCTSITSLSDFKLPKNATIGKWSFAYMFSDCSNLVTPMYDIPKAKTLNGEGWYNQMFQNCTSLTKTPIIRQSSVTALTTGYNSMFYNCSSLSSIKMLQPITSDIQYMFTNVSSVGILETIPENLTTITVPEGWTKIEL